ncbi:MAG: DUF438 domain-containing protein, partial [Thermoplasmata archaeon]
MRSQKPEEELIKEGMPREEIRKLCDLHLKIFSESGRNIPEIPRWHPIHILMSEHEILLGFAAEMQRIAESWASAPEIEKLKNVVEHLKSSESHYVREENVLFPYLERHGITEPPQIMWMEHDEIRKLKKGIYAVAENMSDESPERLKNLAKQLHEYLSSHFYKENNILFPAALRVVSEEEWHSARNEFDALGYCCFTPDVAKKKEEMKRKEEDAVVMAMMEGLISMETGKLTPEELEAILNSLPVDISFVDKENTVRYYNDTKERIFPRTKAVIGRKVQNCHPQKSIDKVNTILNDFREGKREKAEFWINLKGRVIYIRYFPVRNRNGEYIGCLEVTQ